MKLELISVFVFQDYVGAPCLRLEVMGCTRLECNDINECADNNGGCDQKCINKLVQYKLSLMSGIFENSIAEIT